MNATYRNSKVFPLRHSFCSLLTFSFEIGGRGVLPKVSDNQLRTKSQLHRSNKNHGRLNVLQIASFLLRHTFCSLLTFPFEIGGRGVLPQGFNQQLRTESQFQTFSHHQQRRKLSLLATNEKMMISINE